MELYTIDKTDFRRNILIDGFESLIWTERFFDPGDFSLVTPATRASVKLLRPGTILGLSTSRELQMVDTRQIKDSVITATGKTLEAFFDNRRNGKLDIFNYPGAALGEIFENMQDRRSNEFEIPRVRLGLVDESGVLIYEKIPAGKAHETMLAFAKKHLIGMALYWTEREDGLGYDLAFSTRALQDRTTLDAEGGQIIFSPDLDNLADVSELLSNVDSKNVAVAYPPKSTTALDDILDGVDPIYRPSSFTVDGFDLRVIEINMDFISKPDQLEGDTTAEKRDALEQMMTDRAKAALKSKKRVVDGEFTPAAQYKYYTALNLENLPEYRLGDIVSVRGNFTDPVKSVLTEYIHSSDGTGARSYPGFVSLDELETEETSDA